MRRVALGDHGRGGPVEVVGASCAPTGDLSFLAWAVSARWASCFSFVFLSQATWWLWAAWGRGNPWKSLVGVAAGLAWRVCLDSHQH